MTDRWRCRSIPTNCLPSYSSIGASYDSWNVNTPASAGNVTRSGGPAPSSHQVGELPGRCQDRSSPTAGAEVSESLLFASNGEPIEALEVSGLHGNRIHKFQAPADNLQVSYTATIVGKTDRAPVTDYDLTMYLWPNRYAESDKFYGFAATEFGDYADSTTLLENVSLGVGTRLMYVPGSSDPIDRAVDALLAGNGVCRDYAHLVVATAAGGQRTGTPAVYAPGLSP